MWAAVVDSYGPPQAVRLAEVSRPTLRPGQVLVRVAAAAVTIADARIRGARAPKGFALFARLAFGVSRPRRRILGSGFSGIVEAVGADVSGFAPGDEVCGTTGLAMGAHAELVAVPTKRIVRKPAEVSHDDAAGVLFGGTSALYFLRDKAELKRGDSVLVNGASGAVGTNAIQIAKHMGATVTGVTSSRNLGLVSGLGADRTIDYTTTPLAEVTERFDVVLDTVGNLSLESGERLLTDRGQLLLAVADLWQLLRARGRVKAGAAPERTEDFELLLQMAAAGELVVVKDAVLGLEQIASAHERVDSGHKVGNVIVRPVA